MVCGYFCIVTFFRGTLNRVTSSGAIYSNCWCLFRYSVCPFYFRLLLEFRVRFFFRAIRFLGLARVRRKVLTSQVRSRPTIFYRGLIYRVHRVGGDVLQSFFFRYQVWGMRTNVGGVQGFQLFFRKLSNSIFAKVGGPVQGFSVFRYHSGHGFVSHLFVVTMGVFVVHVGRGIAINRGGQLEGLLFSRLWASHHTG